MKAERVEQYKNQLLELAREIREELSTNAEDAATVELDTSIGRLSRMDAMQAQQMALELKRRQQQRLQRIDVALKAIEGGKYGECRKCGQSISEERLEFQPDAVFCVACAGG